MKCFLPLGLKFDWIGSCLQIVVCTWSGQIYAIQSERRLVRFRMLLPGCSLVCGKLFIALIPLNAAVLKVVPSSM